MAADRPRKTPAAHLSLLALGIVFGDIGTSPLYAFRQCLQNGSGLPVDPAHVLGILSLIFWSLILVVCVKYLGFIFWADHDGEGGILALLALIQSRRRPRRLAAPGALVLLVLFGAALLYGDGVITPAISVLSAVEGLKLTLPESQPYIVPIASFILIGLFLAQRRGTRGIGDYFGPVMLAWFVVIAVLGVGGIVGDPQVLAALNPWEGLRFLASNGWPGVLVLGGVVLCFSGAEALFADLGHFGRFPILLAWYAIVLPALLLNYFGQGAQLLQHGGASGHYFFSLVPHWALYPVVALSTAATVIASQALISGVFSLTEQAIYLGYFPPFSIRHTSREVRGQVYIGFMNYALMAACIAIVLGFRSSERLGGAYGLAVIGTMTITSLTYFVVLREVRGLSRLQAGPIVGAFLLLDGAYLLGNLFKIFSGAWVPLLLGGVIFALFRTWTQGQLRYHRALDRLAMPIDRFRDEMQPSRNREKGTAVFLSKAAHAVPLLGKNHWLRCHVRSEQVLLIAVVDEPTPYVAEKNMTRLEQLGPNLFRVTAGFGYMQQPDVTRILRLLPPDQLRLDWKDLIFYLPEVTLLNRGNWRGHVSLQAYKFLRRNCLTPAAYFRVPPAQLLHVSVVLKV